MCWLTPTINFRKGASPRASSAVTISNRRPYSAARGWLTIGDLTDPKFLIGEDSNLGQRAKPGVWRPTYETEIIEDDYADFIAEKFPPRELVMAPWLPQKGIAEIYAERGVGKTWIGMNIAFCVAFQVPFLRWTVPKSRRVVYIDGEMAKEDLQERLRCIGEDSDAEYIKGALRIVASQRRRTTIWPRSTSDR